MVASEQSRLALPRLWLAALGTWLAVAAIAAIVLWHQRGDAIERQARELNLLSLALTDGIDRGLQGAGEGLRALRDELQSGALSLEGAEGARALRVRADLMPLVRSLWLLDREGRVRLASDETPAPDLPSFLPAPEGLAGDAMAISRPFTHPGDRMSLVALAIRVAAAPRVSGGWTLASVPAEALLGAFSTAEPADDARMAVFRSDGARLAGSIVANPRLDEAGVARRLASLRDFEIRRFRDGGERLVSLRGLPRFGLEVMLTRNLDAVLAAWREAARLTATAIALLLALIVVSMYFLQRAYRHRTDSQRALQAQRARASKLEALGTLAGGVAHDFNNVLATIVGFGEMAQDAASAGSDQARHLDKLQQAAARGKALAQRILAFSRGGARSATVFELEPVVEEVLSLLAVSLRPGVVLERSIEARGGRLRGDPTQAFEVVMNLCSNAMQAMPGGGMMSVRLERVHVAAARVLSHSELAPGDYLVLSVADEGAGVTPEVMERLFEPFFTTHAADAGTGLGLAVVHGVVAEFGGAIDVHSAPGRGARFTLYFPECGDAPDAPAVAHAAPPRGAGQELLVVDDEPELVALAEAALEGLGYRPTGFTDPVAALQALRREPRRFAAVITDEVMPALSGTQLTEALREFAPDLPVLLVSGYGGALLASRAAAAGVTRVLAKPVRRAELAQGLAEALP